MGLVTYCLFLIVLVELALLDLDYLVEYDISVAYIQLSQSEV
jgi:uncharacterized membrane protein (DUF373 family)